MQSKNDLRALSREKLEDLLFQAAIWDSQTLDQVHSALAAQEGTAALVESIRGRIQALKNSREYYTYKDVRRLERQVDDLRFTIVEELIPRDRLLARTVMKEFLDAHPAVFEATNDDCFGLGLVYNEALSSFAALYERDVQVDRCQFAADVLRWYLSCGYGVYTNVFSVFLQALGSIGIEHLQFLIEEQLRFANRRHGKASAEGWRDVEYARKRLLEAIKSAESGA